MMDEPVEAIVVGDDRRQLGKRLGMFALALLLLFFSINGYIQSAKNGRKLSQAEKERTELVESIKNISETTSAQTRLIKNLQRAIHTQNILLVEAGLEPVVIPTGDEPNDEPSKQSRDTTPKSEVKPRPEPEPKPRPGPSPKPPDDPSPTPGPIDEVQSRICELTGICL